MMFAHVFHGIRDTKRETKAERKAKIIDDLVACFDASGVPYTCGAAVTSAVADRAQELAEQAHRDGFSFSRACRLDPVTMMRDTFARWAWNAVHKRKYPK